ncbi:MAG TPA: c-type cytochrome [Steroidobacteraceae bacterium]|nr:c-type cytochrome [Steroidobacteraceae bacterium]
MRHLREMRLLSALLGLVAVHAAHGAEAVDAARIEAAASDPNNWLTTGRTYFEERFSPLTQINDRNVARLGLAWFVDFGSTIGLEATPLVADGVMYTSGVWNILHAIDAKAGKTLWSYDPQVPRYIGGMAPTHRATSRILAFKLGGTGSLPPLPPMPLLDPAAQTASKDVIARGAQLYAGTCRLCHGLNAVSGGMTPDLRYMSAETHKQFKQIVLYGARAKDGMAPFADMFDEQDVEAIHAYLIDRAIAARDGGTR